MISIGCWPVCLISGRYCSSTYSKNVLIPPPNIDVQPGVRMSTIPISGCVCWRRLPSPHLLDFHIGCVIYGSDGTLMSSQDSFLWDHSSVLCCRHSLCSLWAVFLPLAINDHGSSRPPQEKQSHLFFVTELECVETDSASAAILLAPRLDGLHVRFVDTCVVGKFSVMGLDLHSGR